MREPFRLIKGEGKPREFFDFSVSLSDLFDPKWLREHPDTGVLTREKFERAVQADERRRFYRLHGRYVALVHPETE